MPTNYHIDKDMLEESDHQRDRIFGKEYVGLNNLYYDGKKKKYIYNNKIHDSFDHVDEPSKRQLTIPHRKKVGTILWLLAIILMALAGIFSLVIQLLVL